MVHLKCSMTNSLQAAALAFFSISAVLGRVLVSTMYVWTWPWVTATVLVGSLMVVCVCLGAICIFLSSQRVSEHHTVLSALFHFIITYYMLYVGKKGFSEFHNSLLNPRQAQEIHLKEIIKKNKDTTYGVTFKLKDIQNLSDFKVKHPVTTYSHYEPFVQRIAKGEKNVMTTERINRLLLTSGTTGKGKQIPRDMNDLPKILGMVNELQLHFFPNVQPMQKIFRLHCNSSMKKSECGMTVGAGMAIERNAAGFLPMFSTPPDGFMIESIKDAFYVHFLFALRERHLGSAFAVFSSMFVDAFKYFEEHWPEMVNDIAEGTINKNLQILPYIRESLEKAIRPGDVQRAEEVRKECEKGQQGIMKRLWPAMEYVWVVDNIGIRHSLMKTVGEGLHVYAPYYGASEALIGVNCNPLNKGDEEYVMAVNQCIYEFIPEEDVDKPDPEMYFIDEVQVGKNYEVVVSQMSGLYRYRFGDVVQISGYYMNTPKVKFLYRTATLLNLFGEKVDQPIIVEALKNALSHWPNIEMKYYCVAESTMLSGMNEYSDAASGGAHYVFFLELKAEVKGTFSSHVDTIKFAKDIDDTIYTGHAFFRKFKDTTQIHESKVYLVKAGTFDELKKFILANTSATEVQFKMPQKLRTKEMAKIMLRNRIQ